MSTLLVLLTISFLLIIVGLIGQLKLPDIYCKLHATSLMHMIAISLVFFTGYLYIDSDIMNKKLLIAMVVNIISSSISISLIGSRAYEKNIPQWTNKLTEEPKTNN